MTRVSALVVMLVVALPLGHASASESTATGWTDWSDSSVSITSPPTGNKHSGPEDQDETLFFTDASHHVVWWSGANSGLFAEGVHFAPQCWGDAGIGVCLAFSRHLRPADIASHVTPAPDTVDPLTKVKSTLVEPKPTLAIVEGSHCQLLDCKIRELPGNSPAELSYYAKNFLNPRWTSLGNVATTWLTVMEDSAYVLHALAIGNDYQLQERSFRQGVWSDWQVLGGRYRGAPGCYSDGQRLQCYAPTYEGRMASIVYDGTTWLPATITDDLLESTPSLVTWKPGQQDMFFVAEGHLMHRIGSDLSWSVPEDLGGDIADREIQCFAIVYAMRCYARFSDGHLWSRLWIADAGNILGFTAEPNAIRDDGSQSSTLRWSTSDCRLPHCRLLIDAKEATSSDSPSGFADGLPPSGSLSVAPRTSMQYTLVLRYPWLIKTQATLLSVTKAPAPVPQPPPSPNVGASALEFWNCHGDESHGETLTVWILESGGGWNNKGDLDSQWQGSSCGSSVSGPGLSLTLSPGVWTSLVVTDASAPGCAANQPDEGACIVVTGSYFGNDSGPVRSLNID